MGQRLNVNITRKGVTIANVYMHWSAYSSSAIDILTSVMDTFEGEDIDRNSSLKDIVNALKDALPGSNCIIGEMKEAGLVTSTLVSDFKDNIIINRIISQNPSIANLDMCQENAWEICEKKLPKEDYNYFLQYFGANRNCGIISVTPKGIRETEEWEEGRVSFDIATRLATFDVYYSKSIADVEEGVDRGNLAILWDSKQHALFEGGWMNREEIDTLSSIIHKACDANKDVLMCGDDLIWLIE